MKKKSLRETQTLRAGCSNLVRRSQTFSPRHKLPSRGAGRQKFNQPEMATTFTYRPSLVKIVRTMHAISSYRCDSPTNKHKPTNKQTNKQYRLQYTAPLSLALSVKMNIDEFVSKYHKLHKQGLFNLNVTGRTSKSVPFNRPRTRPTYETAADDSISQIRQ